MRKVAFLSALLLIPLALAAAALSAGRDAIPGLGGTVWAVERLDGATNTLTAFDAATGDVLGVATVGQRPIGVTAPVGTGKVYTADERSNQLSVFSKVDFVSGKAVVRRIPMGALPHHMAASPDGRFVYVAEYGTHKIGVVDTRIDERVDGFYASGNPAAIDSPKRQTRRVPSVLGRIARGLHRNESARSKTRSSPSRLGFHSRMGCGRSPQKK